MITMDYYGAVKLAKALAKQKNMSIVFENKVQPRTNGKTLYLPYPDPTWDDDQWVRWWFFFYHEEGHCEPTARDYFVEHERRHIAPNTPLSVLCNMLEDYRQEKLGIDYFYGKKKVMEQGRLSETNSLIERIASSGCTDERLKALLAWDNEAREQWLPNLSGCARRLESMCDTTGKSILDKLRAGYTDKLNAATSAEKIIDLAEDILKNILGFSPEELQEQYLSGVSGGDHKDNPDDSGKKEVNSDAEVQRDAKVSWKDLVFHNHDAEENTSEFSLDIDYSTYDHKKAYIPHRYDSNVIMEDLPGGIDSYVSACNLDGTPIKRSIQRYLQVVTRDKYHYRLKNGRLQNSMLYRVPMKNTGQWSKKVFKKRLENQALDTAILLLNDASCSMGGSKFVHAIQSSWMIADTLQALKVPCEIAFFSEESYNKNLYMVVKRFDKNINKEDYRSKCCTVSRYMMNNADPDSVLVAYHRLSKRKEKRKMLIVLSDGQPACSLADGGRDVIGFHKQVVKWIESKKIVEIYGIGIQSESVKNFYSKHIVLHHVEELEEQLFTLIKDYILSGGL